MHQNDSEGSTDPRLRQARALLAQAEAQARAGLPVGGGDDPFPTGPRSASGGRRRRSSDRKNAAAGVAEEGGADGADRTDRRGTRRSRRRRAEAGSDQAAPDTARRARAAEDGGSFDEEPARDAEPDPQDVARQIVLRQLAMGPRSRRQLRDKLVAKGCDPDIAEATLDRMTEVGLVDDEAYAQMLVHSRQESKGLARRALAAELAKKGVDKEIADEALDAIEPDDEEERARALVARRLPRLHGLDSEVQTRRLAGMLARKGYPPGLAFRVVREALNDAPEHRRD